MYVLASSFSVYVLIWGEHWEVEIRGVTDDRKLAQLWQSQGTPYYFEEVSLIETFEQYEEFLKT